MVGSWKLERNIRCMTKIKIDTLRRKMYFIDLGVDTLIVEGKEFLIKELFVNQKEY